MNTRTLTVRELYERLDALRPVLLRVPDMEVVVRVADDDNGGSLGGLVVADVEFGCSETPCLILDGSADAESRLDSDASECQLELPLGWLEEVARV